MSEPTIAIAMGDPASAQAEILNFPANSHGDDGNAMFIRASLYV